MRIRPLPLLLGLLLCLVPLLSQALEGNLPEELPAGIGSALELEADSRYLLPSKWQESIGNWSRLPVMRLKGGQPRLILLKRTAEAWQRAAQLDPAILPLQPGEQFSLASFEYWEQADQQGSSPLLTYTYETGERSPYHFIELQYAGSPSLKLSRVTFYLRDPEAPALLNGKRCQQHRIFLGEGLLSYQYLYRNKEQLIFPLDSSFDAELDKLTLANLPLDPVPHFHPALVDTGKHGDRGALILRSLPSAGSRELARIATGRGIQVASRQGEWLFVQHDSMFGFVRAEFVAGSLRYNKD